jgi:hypothetical protein
MYQECKGSANFLPVIGTAPDAESCFGKPLIFDRAKGLILETLAAIDVRNPPGAIVYLRKNDFGSTPAGDYDSNPSLAFETSPRLKTLDICHFLPSAEE